MMRAVRLFFALALFLTLALHPAATATPPGSEVFQRTWSYTDQPVYDHQVNRSWIWGPGAFTEMIPEVYAEAPNGQRMVQYFDKARMESNPTASDPPWDVTTGLLAKELVTGELQLGDTKFEEQEPAQINIAGDPDNPESPTYATFDDLRDESPLAEGEVIIQTVDRDGQIGSDAQLASEGVTADVLIEIEGINHRVASVFWAFMNSNGPTLHDGEIQTNRLFKNAFFATGYPLTEAYWTSVSIDGTPTRVLVQVFERRVLTYTPSNPEGWRIEAGNVGRHYYHWRYEQLNTGQAYYVDCINGNDDRRGTSPKTAWKSLERANQARLVPGDSLLLKRGCRWQGPLRASWTGTETRPVRIGAYDLGDSPVIASAPSGNVEITGAFMIIEDLKTEHVIEDYAQFSEGTPVGWKLGFNFQDGAHYNTVQRVETSGHAAGFNFADGTHHNRVVESLIMNNFAIWSLTTASTGVLLHGDANEIAYNHFENNRGLTLQQKAVSLEIYNATNSNIHHNVSYDSKFAELGSGSITSRDNLFAYNIHSSDYSPKDGQNGSRFIVTRGEGCDFGPVWGTTLFNNVVYLTGNGSQGVVAGCSTPDVLTMQNNIIVARDKALFAGGSGLSESHNIYWHPDGAPTASNFVQNWTIDRTSMIVEPRFVNPGGKDFHLLLGSPAIDAGSHISVDTGYLHDIDGEAVPAGGSVDIGGDEVGSTEGTAQLAGGPTALPFVQLVVPGRIEAEDYTTFFDTSAGNSGRVYRQDDVDIQATSDNTGSFNIGWIEPGEWLAYDIRVNLTGNYRLTLRVASPFEDSQFHIEMDGVDITDMIRVPNTGGFQKWTDIEIEPIQLTAGLHTLTLVAGSDSFNINYLELTPN